MANDENLVSLADRTTEEKREIGIKGGIASGKARREKKTMRETLEMMLEEIGDKDNGLTYKQLATLGLLKGAITGNATNYRTILEATGEMVIENQTSTPTLNINVVDNRNLEKTLYEENQSRKDDE